VAKALELCGEEIVVVHDAARPLVTPALINAVIERLASDVDAAGAIAACLVTDTISRPTGPVRWSARRTARSSGPSRPRRRFGRRPARGLSDPDSLPDATDDAMLVERRGGRVLIHVGAPREPQVTSA
jgi:2-C-methyl-D-erythritol 4-phosphate cytidylyltransferase